jgi:hypothetical protein
MMVRIEDIKMDENGYADFILCNGEIYATVVNISIIKHMYKRGINVYENYYISDHILETTIMLEEHK